MATPPPPPRPPHAARPGAPKPPDPRAARIEQLLRAEQLEQAAALALDWASNAPRDADAMHFASVTQHRVGENDRALHYAQRAAGLEPANAYRHLSLARCYYLTMQPEKALASMAQASRLDQNNLTILSDYAVMLSGQRRYTDALRVTDDALRRHPGAGGVLINKASLLVSTGRCEEAFTLATQLAEALPQDLNSRSLRCLISNYLDMPAADVFRVHQEFGHALARTRRPIVQRTPRGGRATTRIGIVSADLRAHSVAFFLEPLLEHLDRARFEVFVYHINKLEDATTERLKRHATRWWLRNNATGEEIARAVATDGCDVLLDLGGHTQPQGVIAAAMSPAPVQVTWLGYPNTTGVREVGHRIVDSVTDPAPVADALATESLVRLDPCFLCYRPPEDAPALAPLPAPGSPITFVSYNSLQKITPRVARLWARVLDGVPGSRLLLKMTNLIEADLQRDVRARLVSWGLPVDRTQIMLSVESRTDHLASYGQAHVALDTFPYHGTTTTCESLWMGVPVVTLAGDRHAARVSASLLTAVGTPELIAHTEDEFVERAVTLAGDRERLARYRATLRGMVQASPLCDASAFAKRFGDAVLALVAKTS